MTAQDRARRRRELVREHCSKNAYERYLDLVDFGGLDR